MSASGLRLRKDAVAQQTAPPPVPPATHNPVPPAGVPAASTAGPSEAPPPSHAAPHPSHPARQSDGSGGVRAWIEGIAGFFVAAALLIGLQVWGRFDSDSAWWYTVASFMIGGLMFSIIVIKAFFDTFTQGCILVAIPACIAASFMALVKKVTLVSLGMWIVFSLAWLYYPYYVFVRMERSPILKGIFAALLLASILEWPLLGDATLTGRAMQDMIETARYLRQQ